MIFSFPSARIIGLHYRAWLHTVLKSWLDAVFLSSVWMYVFSPPKGWGRVLALDHVASRCLFPKTRPDLKTAPWSHTWQMISFQGFDIVKLAPKDTNSGYPKGKLIWLSLVPGHSSLSWVVSPQSCGTRGAAVSTGPHRTQPETDFQIKGKGRMMGNGHETYRVPRC